MPIAASLAVAALAASSPLAARPLATTPITVLVTVAPGISPSLVTRALGEARDIWRAAGVALEWESEMAAPVNQPSPGPTAEGFGVATTVKTAEQDNAARPRALHTVPTLRVAIGPAIGARSQSTMPLGWIVFDQNGAPAHEIYVSYANAVALMMLARDMVGVSDRTPPAELETLLGRAMGRALAHELGHYLLASKAHSKRGLMQARRTASEFFGMSRVRFEVDAQQQAAIAARLAAPLVVASLQSAVFGRQSPADGQQSAILQSATR